MLDKNRIFNIFKKELKFTLRDPDLILTIILLPMIIYPLMAIGGSIFVGQAIKKVETQQVKVLLPEVLRPFETRLATESLLISFSPKPEQEFEKLKKGEIDSLVVVATASENFAAKDSVEALGLRILFDSTRWRSDKASDEIYEKLQDVRQDLREIRLDNKNLPSEFFYPIRMNIKDIAKPEKKGGYMVGNVLPMIVIIFSMLSAFYSAIDLTTGEKERGTLETLLLSPVPFNEIITGKFLTIVAVILLSVGINLLFMGGTFQFGLYQMGKMISENLVIQISPKVTGLIFLLMIPFAATVAGLMMSVSFMARSMKEAQNYLAPLLSIMIIPSVSGAVPGMDLTPFTACLPIVNLSLMLKAFFVGEWTMNMYLITFFACTVHCAIVLALAARLFRAEDIFDRGSSEFAHLFHPVPATQTSPTARAAVFIFGAVAALAFLVGDLLQNNPRWSIITGLALLQLLIILAPPMIYLLFYRYRIFAALDLQISKIHLRNFLIIPFMSICVLIFVIQFTLIQNHFFPAPNDLNDLFVNFFKVAPVWWVFFVGCLMAGFCEEVLFRGFILKGLQTRLGKGWALIITSALFGIFHILPHKMVATGLIGLWLGFLYLRTGSLWSNVYAHAFNNAIALSAIYAFYSAGKEVNERTLLLPLPVLAGAAIVFLVLMRFLKPVHPEKSDLSSPL